MTNKSKEKYTGPDMRNTPDIMEWLRRTNFNDLVNSDMHSRDFNGSRAEFIFMRIRLLSIVFAILSLLWIPVDLFIVPTESLAIILSLRIAYSGLFLMLSMTRRGAQRINHAHRRLTAFVLIPCIFYIFSRLALGTDIDTQSVLVGYSFLPYLTVVLLAIFPLTLTEGIIYASLVGLTFFFSEILLKGSMSISTLSDIWLLTLLAGIAIWAQLTQLQMLLRLYREASRDPLTGLVNRRILNRLLDIEITQARQQQRPLSILLFDLDLFKRVNDTYGHLTGDKVLQTFSRLLKRDLSNFNIIGRFGGEEFIAVLPGKDLVSAMQIADRIRTNCHSVETRGTENCVVSFTTSVGVTELQDNDTIDSLINRADKGLYKAKMNGRNTVAFVNEEKDVSDQKVDTD